MSYCRWSSDDFDCDVYAYEHCDGGWAVHVAGSRYVTKPKEPFDFNVAPDLVPIGLAFDGQTFREPSLQAFRDRMTVLRGAGYRFPDYVFEEIDEEMAETRE